MRHVLYELLKGRRDLVNDAVGYVRRNLLALSHQRFRIGVPDESMVVKVNLAEIPACHPQAEGRHKRTPSPRACIRPSWPDGSAPVYFFRPMGLMPGNSSPTSFNDSPFSRNARKS